MALSPFDEYTEELLRKWDETMAPSRDEVQEARRQGYNEGRLEEMRVLVLRLGRRKFGRVPTRKQREALDAVTDLSRLEDLAERLLDASSWADLLNGG